MDIPALITIVRDGGTLAVLVIILAGGHRKWWVFGWQFLDMRAERDLWREIALHGTRTAERAVGLAGTIVQKEKE